MGTNTRKCLNCGAMLGENAKFCSVCGSKVESAAQSQEQQLLFCTQCGNRVNANDSFCMKCGAKIHNQKDKEMEQVIEGSKIIGQNLAVNEEIKSKSQCSACGQEIGENDSFCPNCGENIALENQNKESSSYTGAIEQSAATMAENMNIPNYNQNMSNTAYIPPVEIAEKKPSKIKKIIFSPKFLGAIGGGVLVLVIAVLVSLCYVGKIDGTKVGIFKKDYALAKVDAYLNSKDYKNACDYAVLAQSKKSKDEEFLTELVGKINPVSPIDAYTMVTKYVSKVGENNLNNKVKTWYELGKTPLEDLNVSPISGNYIYPPTVSWEVNQNIIGHGVYYTVDGSEPNETSPKFYNGEVKLNGDCILKLYAVNGAGEKTEIKSFEYEIDGQSQKKIEKVYLRAEKTFDEAVVGDEVGQCLQSSKDDLKKALEWADTKIESPASNLETGELIVSELNTKIKALEDSKVVQTDRDALKSAISEANGAYDTQSTGQYAGYLTSELKKLKQTINEAEEISNGRNPSQEQIDNEVKVVKKQISVLNGAVQTVKMDAVYNQYKGSYDYTNSYGGMYKNVYVQIDRVQGGRVYGSISVAHYKLENGYEKDVNCTTSIDGAKISDGKFNVNLSGTSTYYYDGTYIYDYFGEENYIPGGTEAKEFTSTATINMVQPGTIQVSLTNIGDGEKFNEAMYRN